MKEKRKFIDGIFNKIKEKYKAEFILWFGQPRDDNKSSLKSKFKRYIIECLEFCRGVHKNELQLSPNQFIKDDHDQDDDNDAAVNVQDEWDGIEFGFSIDDTLNYGDIMECYTVEQAYSFQRGCNAFV